MVSLSRGRITLTNAYISNAGEASFTKFEQNAGLFDRDFSWHGKTLLFQILEKLRQPVFDALYIGSEEVQQGILPFVTWLHDLTKYLKHKKINASSLKKWLIKNLVLNTILQWRKAFCICIWKSLHWGWAALIIW